MKLKNFEVMEYVTDSEDNITATRILNKKNYGHLKDTPEPPDELIKDGLKDEYGRYKWTFKDGVVAKKELGSLTSFEEAIALYRGMSLREIVRRLTLGIKNKNNSLFQELADALEVIGED